MNPGEEVKFYAKDYPHIECFSPSKIWYKVYAYVGDELMAVTDGKIEFGGIKGTYYENNY